MDWPTIYTRLQADPNDQPAWEALTLRVRARAVGELGLLGEDAVEDAVADTCTSVVLDLASARGAATFKGFVLGKYLNARKAAIKLASLRRASLDEAVDLPSPPERDGDDPRYLVLDRCLERLPERDRRAVELRYFAEARAEQIAWELGVSEGNARRIVFNGVNRLRKCAQAAVGPLAAGPSR